MRGTLPNKSASSARSLASSAASAAASAVFRALSVASAFTLACAQLRRVFGRGGDGIDGPLSLLCLLFDRLFVLLDRPIVAFGRADVRRGRGGLGGLGMPSATANRRDAQTGGEKHDCESLHDVTFRVDGIGTAGWPSRTAPAESSDVTGHQWASCPLDRCGSLVAEGQFSKTTWSRLCRLRTPARPNAS